MVSTAPPEGPAAWGWAGRRLPAAGSTFLGLNSDLSLAEPA